MKRILLLILILVIVAVGLVGPSRTYGILGAQQLDGEVVKIVPHGISETTVSEHYLIEMHVDPNLVHLVPSNDPQWLMVNAGDRVRVRLYPSPPWLVDRGPWQNAVLLSKLARDTTSMPAVASIDSKASQ